MIAFPPLFFLFRPNFIRLLLFLLFRCCCLCAHSHFWLLFWHQTCLDWKWKIASVKSLIFIVRLDLRVCVKSKLCWRQITDTNAWILLSTHFRLNFSDCLVLFFHSFVPILVFFLYFFQLVELDMSSGSFKKLKQMHDTSKHIFHNDWKLGTWDDIRIICSTKNATFLYM